jgi:hypothetical protein
MKIFYPLILLLLVLPFCGNATHIKGGRIFYNQLNATEFEITFIGYRDISGVPFGNGLIDFGDGLIFGDTEDEVIPWSNPTNIGNGIEEWTFTLVHTYTISGNYIISYAEENRNSDIKNITESVSTPFYVEGLLAKNQQLRNSSALIALYPEFFVPYNNKFEMNLNAVDLDGDSLSYHLVIPKKSKGLNVSGYLFPSDPIFSISNQSSQFGINSISGNLYWDKPEMVGYFSIAIKINEWRQFEGQNILIGFTIVDYVIQVANIKSPPTITVPKKICHTSDEQYINKITIENPGSHDLQIHLETDLTDLLFDGVTVSEWNEFSSENSFSSELIEIELKIPQEKMKTISGFNRTLISVSGEFPYSSSVFQGVAKIDFTSAFLIAPDCDEASLFILAAPKANKFFLNYTEESISITSNEIGIHTIQILDISGKQLFQTHVEIRNGISNIPYLFQPNTVYLIFAQNSSGTLTEKVIFK